MNTDPALKPILDSLDIGLILIGKDRQVLFINDYLKNYLDVYNTENLYLNDLFEIFIEDKKIDYNAICGHPEAYTNGVVYEREPLILATKKEKTKVVKIKSIKNEILAQKNIANLIIIEDVSSKSELEKMKIDFSSQTVHILRTPLTIIRNNLEFLSNPTNLINLNPKAQENIKSIEYATNELLALVQNLITINEIENEKIEINLSESYLTTIIEAAIKDLEEMKNKTQNSILIINPLYELPKIKVDALKIVSVFKGILTNSLRHTTNSDILINLSKDQKYVIAEIIDKGEGISETGLRFIFNKFYHSKKNPLVMEPGLGIGLYSCKKIIEAHLGEISIESQIGVGTKVRVKLRI